MRCRVGETVSWKSPLPFRSIDTLVMFGPDLSMTMQRTSVMEETGCG